MLLTSLVFASELTKERKIAMSIIYLDVYLNLNLQVFDKRNKIAPGIALGHQKTIKVLLKRLIISMMPSNTSAQQRIE